jgi:hypothetical protein
MGCRITAMFRLMPSQFTGANPPLVCLACVLALAAGCLVAVPGPVVAQWGGDPAQSGATVYCDAINSGRSPGDAELAAVQVMQQLVALGQGSLVIQQPVLPPSVLERWSSLVESLCPGADTVTLDGVNGI